MAFGQDFLKTFFGNDYLKDYTHASKTFRTNGYENTPRYKFLFHVYFTLNTSAIPQLRQVFNSTDNSTIGLLVKNIELPKYQIDVEVMNQYNRKRLIQKKINYNPVRCVFHDDGGDLIRTLWYNYYSYYYKDPNQPYNGPPATNGTMGLLANKQNGFNYNSRDIYTSNRPVNDWGYVGESYTDSESNPTTPGGKPPFFRDIVIYGLNQHKWVSYTLVNPLISEWNHDTYDYSQGDGVMENSMTINYETVKYFSGGVGAARPDTYVQGFANPTYYDTVKSSLGRPGGTRSILGQGGILDTGIGIIQDLQAGSVAGAIGAVQKAGTLYNTWKTADIRASASEEIRAGAKDVLRSTLPTAIRNQPVGSNVLGQPGPTVGQRINAPMFLKP